jgi:hypothetical protein
MDKDEDVPTIINVWTKHGKFKLCGNGENVLSIN